METKLKITFKKRPEVIMLKAGQVSLQPSGLIRGWDVRHQPTNDSLCKMVGLNIVETTTILQAIIYKGDISEMIIREKDYCNTFRKHLNALEVELSF